MKEVAGEYQGGFRKNRSMTYQIFAMWKILDKCYEYDVDIHYSLTSINHMMIAYIELN